MVPAVVSVRTECLVTAKTVERIFVSQILAFLESTVNSMVMRMRAVRAREVIRAMVNSATV